MPAAAAGGAVRIMSIHQSKGLEFPVVFLGGTSKYFNESDLRETVLVHPELGLGPKVTDAARGIEYPTIARRAVAHRLRREQLSEELRLLYVAMTRARERLIITCAWGTRKRRPPSSPSRPARPCRPRPSPVCAQRRLAHKRRDSRRRPDDLA